MSLPSQQVAVITGTAVGTTILTKTHPIPTPTPSELLIHVHSAALNPSDWMARDWLTVRGDVLGFDYAGTVITPNASGKFRAGDRVAGFVPGAYDRPPKSGAFAEYLIAPSHTTIKIPDDMSFEEAATLGMGIATAGQAVYQTLLLPMEGERLSGSSKKVLVHGASTATGQFAVQLAKEAGAYVIATSGAANIDFVLKLGADVVVDYKDEKAMQGLDEVGLLVDCISTTESAKVCMSRFGNAGGRYAAVLRLPDVAREGVVGPVFRLCYTVFGQDVLEFKGSEEEKEFGRKLFEFAERLLMDRQIRPLRVRVLEGGLAAVEDAITEIKKGKVRGSKWVVRIGDTRHFGP